MATTKDRSTLDKTLAELLGFEDGVSDVVEHLLTIESSEVCLVSYGLSCLDRDVEPRAAQEPPG